MRDSIIFTVALSIPALAQTFDPAIVPSGFSPSFDLSATFTNYTASNSFTGIIPLAIVQTAPQFATSPTLNTSYVVAVVDPDAAPPNAQVLHYFAANVTSIGSANPPIISNTTPATYPYLPPAPPAGSGAHRYHILLYSQPADLVLKGLDNSTRRTGYNISAIAAENALTLLGATLFRTEYSPPSNGTVTGTDGTVTSVPVPPPTSAVSGAGILLPAFSLGAIGSLASLFL